VFFMGYTKRVDVSNNEWLKQAGDLIYAFSRPSSISKYLCTFML